MKLLFDQNISHKVLQHLPSDFLGSTTVKQEGLINAPDREIWEYAKANNYTIVTQDSDFNDLNLLHGFPPKVIWVRTGNLTTLQIVEVLIDYFQDIEQFLDSEGFGCLEIVNLKQ